MSFTPQITPREDSNNIFLDKLQLVVARGENNAGMLVFGLYTTKKKKKIKKELKLQIFKVSTFTFTKYLAKLNLYSLLPL